MIVRVSWVLPITAPVADRKRQKKIVMQQLQTQRKTNERLTCFSYVARQMIFKKGSHLHMLCPEEPNMRRKDNSLFCFLNRKYIF